MIYVTTCGCYCECDADTHHCPLCGEPTDAVPQDTETPDMFEEVR